MDEVLIEVKGGIIQNVYAKNLNINVRIIDYDNIEQGSGLDLSPYPVLYTLASFRDFFTNLSDPLTQEIYHELQRLHL